MSVVQLRNVNLSRSCANATSSLGVGYTVLDAAGTIVTGRTVTGVYQLASGSGLYAAAITFPDHFRGQVMWDTGTAFPTASYAVEQYNYEENNPRVDETWSMVNSVTGSIQTLLDITEGRWKIVGNQMLFYKADNVTLVATYNLFDNLGNPSMDAVFERVKV